MAKTNVTSSTRAARQLYLYGNGDGKRILSVQRLAKEAGIHEETVRTHIKKWEAEAEEMLSASSSSGLALHLSREQLDQHKSDMVHLRAQIGQVKFELDRMEEITARLENWLEKFQEDEMDCALRIFDAWQRACGSKASLRSQFLAMQKQWTGLSGIVDMKDIEVVRAKEISKGKAKLDLKALENQPRDRDVTPASFFDDRLEDSSS